LSSTPQFRGAQQHEEITMARKNKNASTPTEPITLAQLSERYIAHLEQDGKSLGTQFSYRMEMRTAEAELGADTIVGTLTAADIEKFNTSDRVMRLKSGKPKAEPSFLKTQRVLRLALAFAEQTGLIEKSPIPAKVQKSDEPVPEPEPTPAPKKTRKSRVVVEVVNEPQAEPAPAA
jgi:hypothetical protein